MLVLIFALSISVFTCPSFLSIKTFFLNLSLSFSISVRYISGINPPKRVHGCQRSVTKMPSLTTPLTTESVPGRPSGPSTLLQVMKKKVMNANCLLLSSFYSLHTNTHTEPCVIFSILQATSVRHLCRFEAALLSQKML